MTKVWTFLQDEPTNNFMMYFQTHFYMNDIEHNTKRDPNHLIIVKCL